MSAPWLSFRLWAVLKSQWVCFAGLAPIAPACAPQNAKPTLAPPFARASRPWAAGRQPPTAHCPDLKRRPPRPTRSIGVLMRHPNWRQTGPLQLWARLGRQPHGCFEWRFEPMRAPQLVWHWAPLKGPQKCFEFAKTMRQLRRRPKPQVPAHRARAKRIWRGLE